MWIQIVDAIIRWAVPFVLGGAVSIAISTTKKMKKRDEEMKRMKIIYLKR